MMSFVFRKHNCIFYIILFSLLLNNCQIREQNKLHGVVYLENREKLLKVGSDNKNNVIELLGQPHSKSLSKNDNWIYFERKTSKGKLIKLGQNVLKTNNVLELKFDKYGILISKKICTMNEMNSVKLSKEVTVNDINSPGFMQKFLSSIRQKMYGNKR
jgi:outer membrane protein assembly factor BamE (lipoprotein component of BamABCDE complex)